MNLFEYDEAIRNFELVIDDETGEILNANELDALNLGRDAKIEGIAMWIKELKAEAEAIKSEKDSLAKRQKSAENKAIRLAEYLSRFLDGEKFKTPKVSISYRTSKSLAVDDETKIPGKFFKVITDRKLDKTEAKKALMSGEVVPGCHVDEAKNIQIK